MELREVHPDHPGSRCHAAHYHGRPGVPDDGPMRLWRHGPAPALHSFDVFDTSLTRLVARPEDVHHLVGVWARGRGLLRCGPASYARARLRAEVRARCALDGAEVRFDQVLEQLRWELLLDEATACELGRAELDLEHRLALAVPATARLVGAARSRGLPVAFVSDMYLPPPVVRRLLRQGGLYEEGDLLLVSSDAGTTKADGRLFDALVERSGVQPARIVHHGDNPGVDVGRARQRGIPARLVTSCRLTRFEEILHGEHLATDGLASLLAGASRATRLRLAGGGIEEAVLNVAAGVAAPVLVGFVLWLLARASELGVRRLCFLSREGQLMLALARDLAPRLGCDVELGYLYGARQVFHSAAASVRGATDPEWLCEGARRTSLAGLLARANTSAAEAAPWLRQYGLTRARPDRLLDRRAAERYRALVEDAGFQAHLVQRAAGPRAELVAYLEQELAACPDEWALVDVGWSGRSTDALCDVIASLGRPQPRRWFLGHFAEWARREPADEHGPIDGWLFRSYREHGDGEAIYPLEVFAAGAHGPVLGYDAAGGRVVPRLGARCAAAEWGIGSVHRVVRAVAGNLFLDGDYVDATADLRGAARRLLHEFWWHPRQDEVRAWGGFPFEEDPLGSLSAPMASGYSLGEVMERLRAGPAARHRLKYWPVGALMLSAPPIRAASALAARLNV
jgi:FMN phosphatase YigB (HAD superfamily)